jgi:hypothetical protein
MPPSAAAATASSSTCRWPESLGPGVEQGEVEARKKPRGIPGVFCLVGHQRAPSGCSSRYRPLPSRSFCGLSAGFALRMAVSVRGIGQLLDGNRLRECPGYRQIYRHLPPDSVGLGWTALRWIRKRPESLYFQVFPALVAPSRTEIWWSQGGSNSRPRHCERRALPAELWPRITVIAVRWMRVGPRQPCDCFTWPANSNAMPAPAPRGEAAAAATGRGASRRARLAKRRLPAALPGACARRAGRRAGPVRRCGAPPRPAGA